MNYQNGGLNYNKEANSLLLYINSVVYFSMPLLVQIILLALCTPKNKPSCMVWRIANIFGKKRIANIKKTSNIKLHWKLHNNLIKNYYNTMVFTYPFQSIYQFHYTDLYIPHYTFFKRIRYSLFLWNFLLRKLFLWDGVKSNVTLTISTSNSSTHCTFCWVYNPSQLLTTSPSTHSTNLFHTLCCLQTLSVISSIGTFIVSGKRNNINNDMIKTNTENNKNIPYFIWHNIGREDIAITKVKRKFTKTVTLCPADRVPKGKISGGMAHPSGPHDQAKEETKVHTITTTKMARPLDRSAGRSLALVASMTAMSSWESNIWTPASRRSMRRPTLSTA